MNPWDSWAKHFEEQRKRQMELLERGLGKSAVETSLTKMVEQYQSDIASISRSFGVPQIESIVEQVRKNLDEIQRNHIQRTLDAIGDSSWMNTAIGRLSAEDFAPPPERPIPFIPLRRTEPAPEDNAITFAQRQQRRINSITASGKDVKAILVTPEGEELTVGAFNVYDAEYVYFVILGEEAYVLTVAYEDLREDEYQFSVSAVEKPQGEEENDEFIN